MRQQVQDEHQADAEKLARMRAVLEGVLWGIWNGANAKAADVWRTALEEVYRFRVRVQRFRV